MSKEAKVGFVFFLGLFILLALTVIIGRGELRIHRGYYTLDILFDDIRGLRRNDVVELSGMEIGRVESIALEDGRIRVALRIDSAIGIRSDSRFSIEEKSLIGGKVVSVTMGSPEAPVLAPGSTAEGETAPTPLELIKQASGFAEHLGRTLSEMESAMPEMKSLLESAGRITAGIEEGKGTIGRLMAEEELYEDLTETVKSARRVSAEVEQLAKRVRNLHTYVGIDSAHNTDTSRTLTKVYLRLEPRPEKLYYLGGSVLTGPGTEWSNSDDTSISLDLQLGRRWAGGRITAKAGILESRPGAGIELALGNRISAVVEGRALWEREREEGTDPFLLRGRLNLRLLRGVYVHAGADDILGNARLNAGLKLEYSDEDIKHLVGMLGIAR